MQGEDRAVKQFQFNALPDYKSVPVGTSSLLRLTNAMQEWMRQNGKGPVTVHCMYVLALAEEVCVDSGVRLLLLSANVLPFNVKLILLIMIKFNGFIYN
ncbi:hypothetical protein DPMN_022110 [Dreissena polymorpha]|uniref:Tyrosine-protein phosphatase domain-containing protein n=1 Tax=Dreissena polymorpha TaxID=45954 RepID=A0A9D4S9T5_DREPO|nr:hypothetical protein DPMN_022110 [Dreissena polymorpha]